jgi:hypothetical protein
MHLQRESVKFLRAMKVVMENPDRWTRGAKARTKAGTNIEPTCEFAWCYSPTGLFFRMVEDLKLKNPKPQVNLVAVTVKGLLEFCANRWIHEHNLSTDDKKDLLTQINDDIGRTAIIEVIELAIQYCVQTFQGWRESSIEDVAQKLYKPLNL